MESSNQPEPSNIRPDEPARGLFADAARADDVMEFTSTLEEAVQALFPMVKRIYVTAAAERSQPVQPALLAWRVAATARHDVE